MSTNVLETTTQSFVIKIWQEETAVEAKRCKWRGRITHVGTGDHGYFENLADIPRFIAHYLDEPMRASPVRLRLLRRLWDYLGGG